MTTKEKFKAMLTDRGMLESQASAVLAEAIPKMDALAPGYKITWNRPAGEYINSFYGVMAPTLYAVAKRWIEENAPQAWCRPMFEDYKSE